MAMPTPMPFLKHWKRVPLVRPGGAFFPLPQYWFLYLPSWCTDEERLRDADRTDGCRFDERLRDADRTDGCRADERLRDADRTDGC